MKSFKLFIESIQGKPTPENVTNCIFKKDFGGMAGSLVGSDKAIRGKLKALKIQDHDIEEIQSQVSLQFQQYAHKHDIKLHPVKDNFQGNAPSMGQEGRDKMYKQMRKDFEKWVKNKTFEIEEDETVDKK